MRIVESTKPLAKLAADLEKAVVDHKFGVLGVHDLTAKMTEKGVAFARECRRGLQPAPGEEGPGGAPTLAAIINEAAG